MKSNPVVLVITAILFGLFNPAEAQIYLSDKDIYDDAEEYRDAEEFVEALPLYLLLEKKDLLNANISYKIGQCYLNIRGKKDKAIPYLESAVKNVSSDFDESFYETRAPLKALLLLGVAYRIDNRPQKAISVFNILKDSIRETDPEFLSVVDMHIKFCENAILLNAFPGEPRKEKLPSQINDEYSNYNPVLVNNDSILYYMEELKFYDALMRSENRGGNWSTPENLTPSIGSDGDHILVGASADGTTLLLYYYEALKAGEIYSTDYREGKWTPMKPLNDNINTQYHETHASFSPDGSTLYFTSNRPGGYGGLDIYKSDLNDSGDWGPAVNLGPVINTPYNEETPIMNADDELLYFSSQGHLSMGGYDIFYALKLDDNKWHQPINMGAPVCTTDDDLFYFPLEENVSGLMSRLEPPLNTGYDIYRYHSMVFANSPRFNVSGKIENVDSANYSEYNIAVIDLRKGDTLVKSGIKPDGKYDLLLPAGTFAVVANNNDGELLKSQLNIGDNSPESITLAAVSEKTKAVSLKEPPVVVNDTLILKTILFAFDNSDVSPENKGFINEVAEFMTRHPEIMVTLEGYADALGAEMYNQILSEKRAQSVAQVLEQAKVNKSRIKIVGFGENNPVAKNTNSDGSDNPAGRAYNRRVIIVPATTDKAITIIQLNEIPDNLRMKVN